MNPTNKVSYGTGASESPNAVFSGASKDFQGLIKKYSDALKQLHVAEEKLRRYQVLEKELEKLQNKYFKLEFEKEKLEHEVHLSFEEIDSLEHIIKTLKRRLSDAESLNGILKNELDEAIEKVSDCKEFSADLDGKIEMARLEERIRLDSSLSEMDRLKAYAKSLESDKEEMQNEIRDLRSRLDGQGVVNRSPSMSSLESSQSSESNKSCEAVKSFCSEPSSEDECGEADSQPEDLGPYGERKTTNSALPNVPLAFFSKKLNEPSFLGSVHKSSVQSFVNPSSKSDHTTPSFRSLPGTGTSDERQRRKSGSRRNKPSTKKVTTHQILARSLAIVEASAKKNVSYPSLDDLLSRDTSKDSDNLNAIMRQIQACGEKNAGRMRAKAA